MTFEVLKICMGAYEMVLFISELFTNQKSEVCPMYPKRMSFSDLKALVAKKNFRSMREYQNWVREVNSPEIPLHPASTYGKKGWKGSTDFLSKDSAETVRIQSIQGRRGALVQHYGENAVNSTLTVVEKTTPSIQPVSIKTYELDYRDKSNALFILAKSGCNKTEVESLIEKLDWTIEDAKKMAKDLLEVRLGTLLTK